MASSNAAPAVLMDSDSTTPLSDTTAASVVPPPISMIIWPSGRFTSSPAPTAVATAEGTRYTLRPPASMTAFTIARSSTPVMLPGTHTSTRERNRLKLVTRRMNSRSISQVMS